MTQEITNGIAISVQTKFGGIQKRNQQLMYWYEYFITIQNESSNNIQLIDRHWEIFDSLNFTEIIQGIGVIGQQPIILINSTYSYKSHCILNSTFGNMKGYYTMLNLDTQEYFKVKIPPFNLFNNSLLN